MMKTRSAFAALWILTAASVAAGAGAPAEQTEVFNRPAPAGKVRGPWSDARIGTRVDMKDVEASYFKDIITLKTMEVVAADDESVTVKISGSVNGKKKNDQSGTFPRFVPPSELKKLTDTWGRKAGQRKLRIKDKEVLCDVYERREKHATEDVVGTRSTYVSERVPAWVVRIDDHYEGADKTSDHTPHLILDFTWGPEEKAPLPKVDAQAAPAARDFKLPAANFAPVPATPQNRALASELMARVVKAYFSIVETDATAFDASYSVKKNDAPVGTARSNWNSEAGETTTKFSGSLNDEEAGWLSTLANLGLLQSVFTEGDHDRLYAAQITDGFVFSDEQAVNDTVKSRQALLSADLAQSGEILRLANGVVRRIVRKAESAGGTLFVRTARIAIRAPEGAGRTADYAFVFVTKGGLPFVGTMTIADTSVEGTTIQWVLQLEKISFTRPAKRP